MMQRQKRYQTIARIFMESFNYYVENIKTITVLSILSAIIIRFQLIGGVWWVFQGLGVKLSYDNTFLFGPYWGRRGIVWAS